MTNEELNTALYKKMFAEQEQFKDWLLTQPPQEILNHAYEYTMREDILLSLEYNDLTDSQAAALLASPTPLDDLFHQYEKMESSHMEEVWACFENRAEQVKAMQAQAEAKSIYQHSSDYAREHGELEQYRASNQVNVQCKEAIEAAVREHFDGLHLSHNAAKGVIETYGLDRVMLVLANTVQLQDWDGRYSRRNKDWARNIPNYNSDTVRFRYELECHPAVLDGFIDLVREEQQRRQTLTTEDIQAEAGRILQELRTPEAPNSPNGTHFMARISPEFLNRAGSEEQTRLMTLLPFRSAVLTGMNDRPGTFITILAEEDRTKELRQPRTSVREHLKQGPKQAEPKVQAHRKREPER